MGALTCDLSALREMWRTLYPLMTVSCCGPSGLCCALPGYWAFGNGVGALVLSSLTEPSWAVMLAWAFAITQLVGTTQV